MAKQEKQYAMFPIKNQEIFDMYQEQVANFWTATEISLDQDVNDWKKLNENEQHLSVCGLQYMFKPHLLSTLPAVGYLIGNSV